MSTHVSGAHFAKPPAPTREQFGSHLGFILISAGCAVGLGNVWRFPYIVGKYGGGAFILMYLLFLITFTLPILIMEYAVGRGSQRSVTRAFDALEKPGSKWHLAKWPMFLGNILLMMFYTTVAGWMIIYVLKSAAGVFEGVGTASIQQAFPDMLADPMLMLVAMVGVVLVGMVVTMLGLKRGVERVTKFMMLALFLVLAVLCVRSLTLPGAMEGLEFYLKPDISKLTAGGFAGFSEVIYAAMGQAFFTASVGMGSMAIFGSYINKERSLTGEAVRVVGLDTLVAFMAGLIIFPACATYSVDPASGPGLVFVTLPSIFEQMWLGQVWCTLFFLFMSFAALSTVIAVFENIMSMTMDQWRTPRIPTCIVMGILIGILSVPCVLGFNLWGGFSVPGIGDIQSLEDFIVSNNILPLGGLVFLLFCVGRKGWGWDNFLAEVNTGKGMRFPRWARGWLRYCVPILMVIVFVMGYLPLVRTILGIAS